MNEIDQKIFAFVDHLKQRGEFRFDTDFCKTIGMTIQHFQNIKTQGRHFTAEHIKSICKEFNLNANWLFHDDSKPFYKYQNSNIKNNKNQVLAEK